LLFALEEDRFAGGGHFQRRAQRTRQLPPQQDSTARMRSLSAAICSPRWLTAIAERTLANASARPPASSTVASITSTRVKPAARASSRVLQVRRQQAQAAPAQLFAFAVAPAHLQLQLGQPWGAR
jgi:hypothetical protein